jgi:hypothetical protein
MKTLTPSQKGAAAEAAITSAVIQLGLTVLRPLCEGRRYDLIVDLEPALLRVQCKLARRVRGVLSVRLQTSRYTPHGYVFTSYSPSEIDAVIAYSTELNRSFLLPIADVAEMRGAYLRLEPTRNNQAEGIKWAGDYELEPMIDKLRNAQHVDCSCDRQLDLPSSVSGL